MGKNLECVAAALIMLVAGCGPSTPTSGPRAQSTQQPIASQKARSGTFSRGQLIADARQLAEILESAHPNPYINGGGRIAFHRRLHRILNAIPEDGMTRDEFYRLGAILVGTPSA